MDSIQERSLSPIRPDIAALRSVDIFEGLDDRVLAQIAAISELRAVPAGYRIQEQGGLEAPFSILLAGQISCFRTAPDGTVTVVEVIQPAGHAGLQSVLTQLPSLIGLETVAPSRLVLVEALGLRMAVQREPSLATALLRAEANDLRAMILQVCDLKLRTTAQRLGHYLLSLAPASAGETASFRLPFDKRLLAARLGCRQENLSRAFATLRDIGVETHGARVELKDIPRLRDYAVASEGG